ncbi:MAG: Hpt domain-containing protein [Desulfovibrio sp.]|nr:Hpt domain-containing protein [Desulfovibrio sp.]
MVHALKSAAANIGANELSQSAAFLERAGREAGLSVIRDKLPSFRKELAALMTQIGEFARPEHSGDGAEPIPPEMREALTHLLEALKAKDFDEVDALLACLQALPLTGKIRAAVSELADLILIADFGRATDRLADILMRRNDG